MCIERNAIRNLEGVPDHEAVRALEAQYPNYMVFRQGKGIWHHTCFARHRATGDQLEAEGWSDLRDLMHEASC